MNVKDNKYRIKYIPNYNGSEWFRFNTRDINFIIKERTKRGKIEEENEVLVS